MRWVKFLFFIFLYTCSLNGEVVLGADRIHEEEVRRLLLGKRLGLLMNQTSRNQKMESTLDVISSEFDLRAIFSPEHGIDGSLYAGQKYESVKIGGVPIYSLFGNTRRPTPDMLQDIDILIYDLQDIGTRSYTYISTLFYIMEECAKHNVEVMVLDRPNPLGGELVDGPMLEEQYRSFVGYINVPYCHGMTVGELAKYFNSEYQVNCRLHVVSMRGWTREMTFADTELCWVPTSPYIPESDTPLYYPSTGILGVMGWVNIGIGYTLPFKMVGAPWIDGEKLAKYLNQENYPGVHFLPTRYRPFFGKYKGELCGGVQISVRDPKVYLPVSTQFLIMGVLKNLYPSKFDEALESLNEKEEFFNKVNGTQKVLSIMKEKSYIAWPLRSLDKEKREAFKLKRRKYFLYS